MDRIARLLRRIGIRDTDKEPCEEYYKAPSTVPSAHKGIQHASTAKRRPAVEDASDRFKKDADQRFFRRNILKRACMATFGVLFSVLVVLSVFYWYLAPRIRDGNTSVSNLPRGVNLALAPLDQTNRMHPLLEDRLQVLLTATRPWIETQKKLTVQQTHDLWLHVLGQCFREMDDPGALTHASNKMSVDCMRPSQTRYLCHMYSALKSLAEFPRNIDYIKEVLIVALRNL